MLKIRLFCANGMSTSLLVKKMEEAAKEKEKKWISRHIQFLTWKD